MKKLLRKIFFCFLLVSGLSSSSQNIGKAEYFFNTDPGFGNGTSITLPAATDIQNFTFSADINSFPVGVHRLFIRTQDVNGTWSQTHMRLFYKGAVNSSKIVTRIEYFLNTDPGYGNGINIPIGNAADIANITFQPDINSLPVGIHRLFIRSLDNEGSWSISQIVLFYKAGLIASPVVNKLEYFIDTDPGFGNGTNIPVSASADIADLIFNIPSCSITDGTHYLYIRSKNNAGNWSVTNKVQFTKSGGGGFVTPSVSIAASASTICTGTNVTFTATPVNGGTAPSYQWKVNGNNAGTNSNTFSSSSLNNNDVVTVVITSNAECTTTPTATSNAITITVTSSLTPSVSIAASATTICTGTNVAFTATPVNGGTAPSYQWKVNGNNAGTNSNSFSSSTLNNNDVVTVVMTSNSSCVTITTATSNAVTITVTAPVTPSVSIASSATTICSGSSVTFTASSTSGGTSPSYQWKVNGNNAGTNSSTFSSSTLNNNDVVTVVMTSNASCVTTTTATSNAVTITVTAPVTPSVSIAGSATTICSGSSVTFTATPTSGGTSPSYQWKVNSINTGTNSNTFTSSVLTNNSVVTVVMTSNASCVTTTTATSNAVTITVTSPVTPSVSIAASATTICAGINVAFTATPVNGGTAPIYQWKVNGVNAGSNSNTFSSSNLNNNDAVTVVMTSNANCVSSATANSNSVTVTVNPLPVVNAGTDKTINSGDSIKMDASATVASGSINNILWTPSADLSNPAILNPVAKPGGTITYTITVTTNAGCSASDNVLITVTPVLSGLNIPHGFSPNGDGVNDVWNIRGISAYPGCIMKIFDRYGRAIFNSTGYNTPWDGKYKGNSVPVDTYYYILDLKNGSQVLSGFVTIIK